LDHKVKTVSEFLSLYENVNTRRNYKIGVKKFLLFVYHGSKDDLDALSLRYFEEGRDVERDLISFRNEVLSDLAPTTRNSHVNALKLFFDDNDVTFSRRVLNQLKAKNNQAISWENTPSNEQIKRITEYMPIHGKAMTLMLASSGIRVGALVQLRLEDVDLDMEPVRIRIRAKYTKSKQKRITFISPEAKEALLEWLKYRLQYIKTANARSRLHKRKDESEEIFPFTSINFNYIWRNALDKANLKRVDSRTNRATLHPHGLRKFFRLVVGRHGQDEAEALMGHQTGLNAVYAKFTGEMGERRLREIYLKALPELSIYGRPRLVTEANEELLERLRKAENTIDGLIKDSLVKDAKINYVTEILKQKDELIKQLSTRVERFEAHMQRMLDLEKQIDERLKTQDRIEWKKLRDQDIRNSKRQ
jgi:integrase